MIKEIEDKIDTIVDYHWLELQNKIIFLPDGTSKIDFTKEDIKNMVKVSVLECLKYFDYCY